MGRRGKQVQNTVYEIPKELTTNYFFVTTDKPVLKLGHLKLGILFQDQICETAFFDL